MPVLLAVSREIAMSSLREWAAKSNSAASKTLRVNWLGKYKTALQLVGVCAAFVFRDEHHLFGPHMGGAHLPHLRCSGWSLAPTWAARTL